MTLAQVEELIARLAFMDRDVSDAGRLDQIAALERVKGAAAAAQARVSVDLDISRRAAEAAAGVPARQRGRGSGPRSRWHGARARPAGRLTSGWSGPC